METKDKIILGLVILIVSFAYMNVITGNVSEVVKNRECIDDDGNDYFTKGDTQSRGNVETKLRVDSCHTNTEVIEYYCSNENLVESEIKDCTSLGAVKCELGKCV